MLSLNAAIRLALVSWLAVSQTRAGPFDWFAPTAPDAEPVIADYDELNSLLVAHVRDESAPANILQAVEWLKMSDGQLELEPHDLELPRKPALVQFTSLLQLMDPDEPNCNLLAYEILMNNEEDTGSDILVPPNQLGALRRIESVIYEVALMHAEQCRYEYPQLFWEALSRAPPRTIKEIKFMMNAIIKSKRTPVLVTKDRYTDPRQVDSWRARFVSMEAKDEARALLVNVRRRSRNDPNTRYLHLRPDPKVRQHWIVDEPMVVEMLNRYVYSRCEYINRSFEHILRPAEFEQDIYSKDYKYRAINDQTGEFMIWLQYFRICNEINKHRRKLEDNIIEAIWSELNKQK